MMEELRGTFESVPRAHVDLLCLRNFFDNFLNHDSVVVSNFAAWDNYQLNGTPRARFVQYEPWRKFDVIVTLDNVDV
jgi:hypothetical protein